MPTKIEPKVVDPEAQLSNAQTLYKELAPQCSVEKRAAGIPQLAPQEKQIDILNHEMEETLLCINLASKGLHAVHDAIVKSGIHKALVEYEKLEVTLRDERLQVLELNCLNYLANKKVMDILKTIPSEVDALTMLGDAYNRLRRMEQRLDLATKKFCNVNTENKIIREEIDRLLIDRHNFNIQWKRTITKLTKGHMYLTDIFEVATQTFQDRDTWSSKLESLKWIGLFDLNKDICNMQVLVGEINHLAKLEEFLRIKGSTKICEADTIAEMKRLEEKARCEQEIARHDALLEEIFNYAGNEQVLAIIRCFRAIEVKNLSIYTLLCEVQQQSIVLNKEVAFMKQRIWDQVDINLSRYEKQDRRLADAKQKRDEQIIRIQDMKDLNKDAENTFIKILNAINEIVRMPQCNCTPLMSLLGNHKVVTKWNVRKFLDILEVEIKSLIQIVYGAVKPTAPVTKPTAPVTKPTAPVTKPTAPGKKPTHQRTAPVEKPQKIISDPHVETLKPNKLETLVPYQPCAYCVEDYIMNVVYETPTAPADEEFFDQIFHLQDVNTKFGIYTLTKPEKRHAYRKN